MIELNEAAWQAFVRLAEAEVPATPLARQEATAFLAEIGGPHGAGKSR